MRIPVVPDLRDFDYIERTMPNENFMGTLIFAALRSRERWPR